MCVVWQPEKAPDRSLKPSRQILGEKTFQAESIDSNLEEAGVAGIM